MILIYSILDLLSENTVFLISFISLVLSIKLFAVLVGRYDKTFLPRHCMAFQLFCFNNQMGVFAVSVSVNFTLLVFIMDNISEAVIGLMTMFYLFRVLLYFKQNDINIIKILFISSLIFRLFTNQFNPQYIIFLIFLAHIYYAIVEENNSSLLNVLFWR